MDSESSTRIEPHELRWLRRLDAAVNRLSGLTSLPDRLWLLKSRVEQRMADLGIGDMEAYVVGLLAQGSAPFDAELPMLVETLRVGETGWFRHARQFRDVARWASDRFASRSASTLKAWCAGCATGEEAYSLAMALTDGMGHRIRCRARILGTDISMRCIRAARSGRMNEEDAENLPRGFMGRFTRQHQEGYRITEAIKRQCTFRVHNLMELPYPGTYDLILCRNVLIYFSPDARATTLNRLAEALLPGGALVLGYSESIREQSDLLEPLRVGETLLWRLRSDPFRDHDARRTRRSATRTTAVSKPHKPSDAPGDFRPTLRDPTGGSVLRLSGSYGSRDMKRLAEQLRNLVVECPQDAVVDLDGVDYLPDEAAALFRRTAEHLAAKNVNLVLVASRPGVVHWIDRSGLGTLARVGKNARSAAQRGRSDKR